MVGGLYFSTVPIDDQLGEGDHVVDDLPSLLNAGTTVLQAVRHRYRARLRPLRRHAWVEVGSLGLVRIVGEVADPPFPVERIKLDRASELVPEGFRLLRRHTGEIDIKLGFIRRHGVMDIFYADYKIGRSR